MPTRITTTAVILSIFIATSVFPIPTQAQVRQAKSAEVKEIPLSDIIDIPKLLIGTSTIPDLSRVDWEQEIRIGSKLMRLGSSEALAALDIPADIKELVDNAQIDLVAIDKDDSLPSAPAA